MPELPEVEVVRAGLAPWTTARRLSGVQVLHPRAVRRHDGGAADFGARLVGCTLRCASRRGKYLWFPLGGPGTGQALVGHLGMSGQLLVATAEAPAERHLRVRLDFDDAGPQIRFVDQRTFGGLAVCDLVPDGDGGHVPQQVAHIARDLLDPRFDDAEFVRRVRGKDVEIKRILLDQTIASGVGNIYADEALWSARVHGARPGRTLSAAVVRGLLGHLRDVMAAALAEGGTSFDALYVDVNGARGYFDRSLAVYGRADLPCPRCATAIRRSAFMNRSSYWCPRCQRNRRRDLNG